MMLLIKADNYPFHIDDLMDGVGKAKLFSTLDQASDLANTCPSRFTGEDSIFDPLKFRVMPFGLKNAPRIFQRLMRQVLLGVNPDDRPSFVTTYIEVFSSSL